MMPKAYKTLILVMFVAFAYALGLMSGYAVGYNDKYSETVVKYRIAKGDKTMKRR